MGHYPHEACGGHWSSHEGCFLPSQSDLLLAPSSISWGGLVAKLILGVLPSFFLIQEWMQKSYWALRAYFWLQISFAAV